MRIVSRHYRTRIALGVAAGSVLLAGCAKQIDDFPAYAPTSLTHHARQEQVAVGAHAVLDAKESKAYFGTDLVKHEVLALLIAVDNQSSRSYFLRPEQVRVEGFAVEHGSERLPTGEAGGAVTLTGALLISAPVMVIGMKMISDAKTVESNFKEKALKNQTLSPGEAVQGFVYFELPEDVKSVQRRWDVVVELHPAGGGDALTVRIPYQPKPIRLDDEDDHS